MKKFKDFLDKEAEKARKIYDRVANAVWFYTGKMSDEQLYKLDDICYLFHNGEATIFTHENYFKNGHEAIIGVDKFNFTLINKIKNTGAREIKKGDPLYHYVEPANLLPLK